jgi:beta-N-acetylhexosaminidase
MRPQRLARVHPLIAMAALCLVMCGACGSSGGGRRDAATTLAMRASSASGGPPAAAGEHGATPREAPAAASASTPPEAGRVPAATPNRPPIVQSPIPFPAHRKTEMRAYAVRHYGLHTYRLINPHVIVIHYTETPNFSSTYETFAADVPDSELHELPNTCAHFVIDSSGAIHQLVPVEIMCRHTVGLNWTAIGIEHVGYSDAQVLNDRRQIAASLRLARWLRCRFRIPVGDVIGHNESLQSSFHHENVAALRTQTHSDFNHADMQIYRARLRALGGCPTSPHG